MSLKRWRRLVDSPLPLDAPGAWQRREARERAEIPEKNLLERIEKPERQLHGGEQTFEEAPETCRSRKRRRTAPRGQRRPFPSCHPPLRRVCTELFTPKRNGQRYCSPRCRNRKWAAGAVSNDVTHRCLACTEERDGYFYLKQLAGLFDRPDPLTAGLTKSDLVLIGVIRPEESREAARKRRRRGSDFASTFASLRVADVHPKTTP